MGGWADTLPQGGEVGGAWKLRSSGPRAHVHWWRSLCRVVAAVPEANPSSDHMSKPASSMAKNRASVYQPLKSTDTTRFLITDVSTQAKDLPRCYHARCGRHLPGAGY